MQQLVKTNTVPAHFRQFVVAKEGTLPEDPNHLYDRAMRFHLGNPIKSTIHLSASICSKLGQPHYVGLDYLSGRIVIADRRAKLRSGKELTLASARYVGQYARYAIIGFPETKDLELFRNISHLHSGSLGPGFFNQGSIGEISYEMLKDTLSVHYFQSSVNFKKALEAKTLDESYRRAYSGWDSQLAASLFDKAKRFGAKQILLPISPIVDNLQANSKLDQIAEIYGFEQIPGSGMVIYCKS